MYVLYVILYVVLLYVIMKFVKQKLKGVILTKKYSKTCNKLNNKALLIPIHLHVIIKSMLWQLELGGKQTE